MVGQNDVSKVKVVQQFPGDAPTLISHGVKVYIRTPVAYWCLRLNNKKTNIILLHRHKGTTKWHKEGIDYYNRQDAYSITSDGVKQALDYIKGHDWLRWNSGFDNPLVLHLHHMTMKKLGYEPVKSGLFIDG